MAALGLLRALLLVTPFVSGAVSVRDDHDHVQTGGRWLRGRRYQYHHAAARGHATTKEVLEAGESHANFAGVQEQNSVGDLMPPTQKLVNNTHPLGATQYFGVARVGKPLQALRVVFDTGSGELVIPSSLCDDPACVDHRRFSSQNSSTALQIGWADEPKKAIGDDDDRDTKSLTLLGAETTGEFIRDNVCVGEQGQQVCGMADFVTLTEESNDPFDQMVFDGVLGLAPKGPDAKEFNVMKALLGEKVNSKMFALYLAPAAVDHVSGGELTFGGYRKSRAASEIFWVAMANNESWQVNVQDIAVNGQKQNLCGKTGCAAALDSGASLIMAPGNMLWAIMNKLNLDDQCSTKAPTLSFVVNGKSFDLDAEDYLERDHEGCRLLMTSIATSGHGASLVLGYPFLRRYFSVFDAGNNKIGLATANHDEKAAAAEPVPAGVAVVPLAGVRP